MRIAKHARAYLCLAFSDDRQEARNYEVQDSKNNTLFALQSPNVSYAIFLLFALLLAMLAEIAA